MGAGETQGEGAGTEGEPTCAHCPVGLVALLLTWLVVEVLIIAGAGVKAKAVCGPGAHPAPPSPDPFLPWDTG